MSQLESQRSHLATQYSASYSELCGSVRGGLSSDCHVGIDIYTNLNVIVYINNII